MKPIYLLIFFIIFSLYSCEKDEKSDSLSKTPPKLPAATNYDLNDDSINDIRIEYGYFTWDGLQSSGDGIAGSIKPLNGSSILQKHDNLPLFNTINETISISTNEPFYWETILVFPLVRLLTEDNYWPNVWKISSNMTMDFYYLGITINKNNSNLLGWIKIKIDKSNGYIQIVDKKFTTESFIVIGKSSTGSNSINK